MDGRCTSHGWGLYFLLILTLSLWCPRYGLAGGGDGDGPEGQGGEGLDTATQQMFEAGNFGTVKVAENGDVYVVSRYGEPGAKGIDFSRASNDGAGNETYRIPREKLEKATDAELEKFAKEIRAASDTTLGESVVGGQARQMSQTQDEIKDKLKKVQEAYKKGLVKFDTTAKTQEQLRAALKTDPNIEAKLKEIEVTEKKKAEAEKEKKAAEEKKPPEEKKAEEKKPAEKTPEMRSEQQGMPSAGGPSAPFPMTVGLGSGLTTPQDAPGGNPGSDQVEKDTVHRLSSQDKLTTREKKNKTGTHRTESARKVKTASKKTAKTPSETRTGKASSPAKRPAFHDVIKALQSPGTEGLASKPVINGPSTPSSGKGLTRRPGNESAGGQILEKQGQQRPVSQGQNTTGQKENMSSQALTDSRAQRDADLGPASRTQRVSGTRAGHSHGNMRHSR